MFRLGAGDVVLVDEVGMAGTFLLDWLVAFAAGSGPEAVLRAASGPGVRGFLLS
jgi:hypothetical protein